MNSSNSHAVWRYLGIWVLAVTLSLCVLAFFERQSLVREFTTKSTTLHRLASQRADQHDAHLTSLSAIFLAGGVARQDLLLDVGSTIMRFYPRITSINVIPFDTSEPMNQTRGSVLTCIKAGKWRGGEMGQSAADLTSSAKTPGSRAVGYGCV